jgi:hypothetical protein
MIFLGKTSREARIKRFIRRHFGVRVHSLAPYEEALRHSSSVACQRTNRQLGSKHWRP